ncbi:MAG: heparinase II/III-family protein [Clostridia bacterium]|nr:heparinase II/III-family protein [Clostridia bacterium]
MNIKEILDALSYGSTARQNGSGLFEEGRDLQRWEKIKLSPYYGEMLREITDIALQYLQGSIQVLPFSLHKLYAETGNRIAFEKVYFERRGRLNALALLSIVSGEKKYLDSLEDILWAICDEYTWCLPAHLPEQGIHFIDHVNNLSKSDGKIQGNFREHKAYIDLFSAETGFSLAEILYLLEDKLAPMVVLRARKEIRERLLEPYCALNSMFWWETCTMNWSAVCAGSIGAAAIYLIQDDLILASILNRVINAMECFLAGFGMDGACTEGLSYWIYGFGFFTYFAALLKQRTAGKLDMMENDKVRQIALFQQKCYLSENKVISFSDGFTTSRFQLGLTHYLKERFPEVGIPDNRFKAGVRDDHCHRWAHFIRDFVWSNPEYAESKLAEEAYFLEDAQWFISRKVQDQEIICFAAKGGHNEEPHNHNDIGNFILHVNGETLLTDTGAGEYTRQYFGSERYSFFCNGSQGHSVPIIDGCFQSEESEHAAKVLNVQIGAETDIFSLDITKAYALRNLKSLQRAFSFYKTSEVKLVLRDEFQFEEKPASIIERFVSFHEPVSTGDGVVSMSGGSGRVDIVFDQERMECSIKKNVFKDHWGMDTDVYTIDLELKKPELDVTVEVAFLCGR